MGKVMLVNTLIASLFVYKMTVIPRMPENVLLSIKQKILSFIWSGGVSKIQYNMLVQKKCDGGLGLTDLKTKDKALKLTWIQILHNEPELRRIVEYNTVPVMGKNIWMCNLLPKEVALFVKDTFWKEVFEAWFEFLKKEDHVSRRTNDIIWMNSDIKVKKEPVLWETLFTFINYSMEKGGLPQVMHLHIMVLT